MVTLVCSCLYDLQVLKISLTFTYRLPSLAPIGRLGCHDLCLGTASGRRRIRQLPFLPASMAKRMFHIGILYG